MNGLYSQVTHNHVFFLAALFVIGVWQYLATFLAWKVTEKIQLPHLFVQKNAYGCLQKASLKDNFKPYANM